MMLEKRPNRKRLNNFTDPSLCMDSTITYEYQSPVSNDINNILCCVCFYFVALDVSLGFHFLLYVCYVSPAYGCQTEINCVWRPLKQFGLQVVSHIIFKSQ